MTYILWTIALVAAILAAGWVVRFIGQKINWPTSELNVYFRDVGLTEISGYVLGVLTLVNRSETAEGFFADLGIPLLYVFTGKELVAAAREAAD